MRRALAHHGSDDQRDWVLKFGAADDFCEDCGYEPELKRTLGSFQVFAISFAFISVAVGIFATYNDVLKNAGPAGIWLWPIIAVGQILIALVIAQFAARIRSPRIIEVQHERDLSLIAPLRLIHMARIAGAGPIPGIVQFEVEQAQISSAVQIEPQMLEIIQQRLLGLE